MRRCFRDSQRPKDDWAGKEMALVLAAAPAVGDRTRLNAREGSGALSAGQAWKMAARWHELVGMQERGRQSPERAEGGEQHSRRAGRWRDQEKGPRDSMRRRDGCTGKGMAIVLAAASAGVTVRG